MNNPYKILGLPDGASKEEIRIAYKKLVKKYHPDQYANNPLSDLAEEKLKEINEAYHSLIKENKGSYNSRTKENWGNRQNNSGSVFMQVRNLITRGNIVEGERLLEQVSERNAEWHFLKGLILLRKGWNDQAYNYINKAVQMDPNNPEYQSVLNNMSNRSKTYRDHGHSRGYRSYGSACEVCECLICSDCCCECMGGDLIECC